MQQQGTTTPTSAMASDPMPSQGVKESVAHEDREYLDHQAKIAPPLPIVPSEVREDDQRRSEPNSRQP